MYIKWTKKLKEKFGNRIKFYPGSMELRDGKTYALRSRAVAVVGLGEDIEDAREIALRGIEAIRGGALWFRSDIASEEHIGKSVERMRALREGKKHR